MRADGRLRKGERTRERLRIAAITVLDRRPYPLLRVADVVRAARLSHSAFYVYFANKEALVLSLLRDFEAFLRAQLEASGRARDKFGALHETNRRYVAAFRENRGLMRCLRLAADEVPAFAAVRREHDRQWTTRVALSIARRTGASGDRPTHLLVAAALGGMLDAILDNLELRGDSALADLALPPGHLEETLSLIWYRAIYAADPDPRSLPGPHPLLARKP